MFTRAMRNSNLCNLILTLLTLSFAVVASGVPPKLDPKFKVDYSTPFSTHLNAKNAALMNKGTWFVKFFSPFCHHCLDVAPIWKKLAEDKSKEFPQLNFGEIDCVASGDLCLDHGVKAWPDLQWYVDGKHVATLDPKTKRTAEALTAFIDKQYTGAEPSTDTADPNPNRLKANNPPPANPSGMVLSLNAENFTQHISLTPSKSANEGWFVKFYAPWCSHCKHMAAAWTELGREMKGKLNIGQVNCELESKLCKDVKLRGYPTLMFFKGGERVEYDGLRGLGDLVSFANKAVQAGVHDITSQEFDAYEKKEEVIFLYFYDQATTSEDFEALDRTALSLIGHAPLLRTNSEALINRFRITSFPKLIVLRDAKVSYYTALSPRDMRDHHRLLSWMKSVWLPLVPELSAANSHEVMQGRSVVLAILDRTHKDFEQMKGKMKTAALEWMDIRASEDRAEKQELREQKETKIEQAEEKGDKKAIERAKGIQVVVKPKKEVGFAWVDGVFWGRWCRGTYGVDVRDTGPRIIINEQDEKRFWDINIQGKPIQLTTENIVETLHAVLASPPKIKPVSTVGRLETIFRACLAFIRDHPFGLIAGIVGLAVVTALWAGRRSKRVASPTFTLEKRWGDGTGPETHSRQGSAGKGGNVGKFD